MNSNNDSNIQGFKICAGRNCDNIAMHLLTIVLIKQSGWFCERCKQDLQEGGLVEPIPEEGVVMGGESNIG